MSSWYELVTELILKWTVSPLLTEMSLAKPWMPGSPSPTMSHSVLGLPGLEFSQAISLVTGGSHGAAEATGAAAPSAIALRTPAASSASILRVQLELSGARRKWILSGRTAV